MKSGDIVIPYYDTMCRSMTPADIGGLVLVTSAILIPRPVINNVCLFPGDAANDGWLYQDYLTMTNKWSRGSGKLNIYLFLQLFSYISFYHLHLWNWSAIFGEFSFNCCKSCQTFEKSGAQRFTQFSFKSVPDILGSW